MRTRAFETAIELDLFSAVHSLGASAKAEKVAETLSLPARSTRILLDYLTVVGFFTKANGVYSCTPSTAVFLVKSSPQYMGGMVQFILSPALLEGFGQLTAAVRQGRTQLGPEGSMAKNDNKGHEMWVAFAKSMAPMAKAAGPVVAATPSVMPDANAPVTVLDVAAGHGYYGIAFAKANKNARVTFQDWAPVLEVAMEHAKLEGVDDRCDTLPGSAFEVHLQHNHYDIILLTNFLHHFSFETNVALAKRLFSALKPGGRLVTVDFVVNEDRISPPSAAMFPLSMLASTVDGDVYTQAQFTSMFSEAGFSQTEKVDLLFPGQAALVSHKKA